MPYNGQDNTDYVNGKGFSSDNDTREAAQARAMVKTRAGEAGTNERMQFYYHPDHLGSSSYITNLDGEVMQHIEYVPFGEVFIEERNNTWNTPYLFNAKEFDGETGMYYYGARYYEPRLSLWMSTDLLQEKNPNISSYVYCIDNPIKFVDFDGKDWFVNYQGFYLWSNSSEVSGFVYYGATLPNTVSKYNILENINGKLYHKYTTNIPNRILNKLLGTHLVEKKLYDAAWESASSELQSTALGVASWGLLSKLAGPVIGRIISQIRVSSIVPNKGIFMNSVLSTSKNGMTQIGRALQKHAGRANSSFSNINFSGKTATEDGLNVLKDIMNSKKKIIDLESNGTKTIYDKATGRGFSISREGKFNGFRDLKERSK